MNRRLPAFISKTKVCVICEGDEEYSYMKRLYQLGVWDNHYEMDLINAGGNGNIPARYQDRFQNDSSEIVLVFCDTERKPYEQYTDIKRKIDEFHGVDGVSNEVVFFGNPCTMDVIVKHWVDLDLKTPAKKMNDTIIEKYTGVKHYRGKRNQINEIMEKITAANYILMKERVSARSNNDEEKNSSNFDKMMGYLENNDDGWIAEINHKLDG